MFRWFLRWLGGSDKKRSAVRDAAAPMVCLKAFEKLVEGGCGRASRFVWYPHHYIDYNPDTKCFREWSCQAPVFDNCWEMTAAELNDWFCHHRTADYVGSDWIVTD